MDTLKSWLPKLGGWGVVLIVMAMLAVGGESAQLTCNREPASANITCTKQSILFGVIPLRAKTIPELRGARLAETYDQENDTTYRVELVTGRGVIPLTTVYTSGSRIKAEVVDQINAFVSDPEQDSLSVHEPGLLSPENLLCMAIGIPISIAINWILGQIREGHRQRKELWKA